MLVTARREYGLLALMITTVTMVPGDKPLLIACVPLLAKFMLQDAAALEQAGVGLTVSGFFVRVMILRRS